MIDQTDRRLLAWVTGVLGSVATSLTAPGTAREVPVINLYLLELSQLPPARGANRTPLQLALRYLVTCWADEPEEAHRLLGELVFAAMENEEMEVELGPAPATLWAAFNTPPRPSFVLSVPLRRERPEPPRSLVREPLRVQIAALVGLRGVVLGPEDVPVAAARVELPFARLARETDRLGMFHFPAVPSEPREIVLRVKARGRHLTVKVDRPAAEEEQIVIRFDPTADNQE